MTQLDNQPRNSSNWVRQKDVKQVAIIWVILTVIIGYVGSYVIKHAMGAPASETMDETIRMMVIFTWVSAPVAGFVGAICLEMLASKLHYGTTPPEDSDYPFDKNPRAVALWMIISSLLCLFAVVFGLIVMQEDAKSLQAPNAIKVSVTGQQWVWNFDYQDSGVRSQELYLPVNTPVVFRITSKDVKHSFWIVQMGVKMDANPGYYTEMAVTPNKIGVFDVRCAELCGLLHAYMQNQVHVVSQSDYKAWVISQGGQNS